MSDRKHFFDQILSSQFPKKKITYTTKDVIIYAFGIGSTQTHYLYENDKNFRPFPTFSATFSIDDTFFNILKVPPTEILHGEQEIEIINTLPDEGTLTVKRKITDIFDKGSGALVVTESQILSNDEKIVYARNKGTFFIKGYGSFGGRRGTTKTLELPPPVSPGITVEVKIPPTQALLYRLSGDFNPLHASEETAQKAGYPKPILHGLCTLGYCTHHVVEHICNGNDELIRKISVRFLSHVFPGDTLVTQIWKVSRTKCLIYAFTKEREKKVIHGVFDFKLEELNSKL